MQLFSMKLFSLPSLICFVGVTAKCAVIDNRVSFPEPTQFRKDNGTKWSIKYVGNIKFTQKMQSKGLGGDKCRSSKLGNKVIWNCGDMQCQNTKGEGDYTVCGFAMVTLVPLMSLTCFVMI